MMVCGCEHFPQRVRGAQFRAYAAETDFLDQGHL